LKIVSERGKKRLASEGERRERERGREGERGERRERQETRY
jgi:hypothetical protein